MEKRSPGLASFFNALILISILGLCTLIAYGFFRLGFSEDNIITVYIIGILVASFVASKLIYGLFASIIGVSLYIWCFAQPLFTFPSRYPQYILTLIMLLAASIITSIISTQYRRRERAERRAEQEMIRANLLRSISHDLRTPLTSISGNADLLLSNWDSLDPDRRGEICRSIYDESHWLIDMVENLLFITRMENNSLTIDMEPELISDIVSEAVKHLAHRKDLYNLKVSVDDDLLMALMDSRLIIQVLINLLDNALKYTPPGTDIEVNAFRRAGMAVVEVADTGGGIIDADKSRIFELFYSGKNKEGDRHRGIGIGLALCQTIVTAHGGEMYMRDNDPHGAIFGFTLNIKEVSINDEKDGIGS